jgi:hypothetical protein
MDLSGGIAGIAGIGSSAAGSTGSGTGTGTSSDTSSGGLTADLTKKACDTILAQAKSFL